jgi:hypothetical protein
MSRPDGDAMGRGYCDAGAVEFADCDGSGVDDGTEIVQGVLDDANGNLVPDVCDFGIVCDVDGNQAVDVNDVDAIFAARGTAATGPDDPMDADEDGLITVGDGRLCVLACTNPNCTPTEPLGDSVQGQSTPIPEPGWFLLLASGIAGLGALHRLRKRARR